MEEANHATLVEEPFVANPTGAGTSTIKRSNTNTEQEEVHKEAEAQE